MVSRGARGAWITAAVGLACLGVLAAGWSRRDDLRALVSRDFAAWRDVVRLIESRRSPEHRSKVRIKVPYAPVKIPETFEVRLHGRYLDTQLLAITIEGRDGRVEGGMASKRGLLEGNLPRLDVEAFLRKVRYLNGASQEGQEGTTVVRMGHAPDYTLEISTGPAQHGDIEHRSVGQAVLDTIEFECGLGDFRHTWICEELRRLAETHLRPPGVAAQKAKVLGRLAATGGRPSWQDRDSILAEIHAYHAVELRLGEALPALKRLGFSLEARRLEVATAPDPRGLLKECLMGVDGNAAHAWKLCTWALDFMADPFCPVWRKEVLIEGLGAVRDEQVRGYIIENLSLHSGDRTVEEALRRVFESAEEVEIKIKAAGALLRVSNEREAFDHLITEALEPGEKNQQLSKGQEDAVLALLTFGTRSDARRAQVARTLRALIARIPFEAGIESGLFLLLQGLASLGLKEDEALLLRYIEHPDDALASVSIYALGKTRPRDAIEVARKRVRLLIGSGKERIHPWHLDRYHWLFCALEACEAIPEIEAVRAVLMEGSLIWRIGDEPAKTTALLGVLLARTVEERLRRALEFVRLHHPARDELFDLMLERFRADGASPEALAQLHAAFPPPPKRSTVDW